MSFNVCTGRSICLSLIVMIIGLPNNGKSQSLSPADSVGIDKTADDPTELITRVELRDEFYQTNTGGFLNLTTARLVYRAGKRFSLRADLPFAYSDPRKEGMDPAFGLSDVSVRLLGWRIVNKVPWVAVTSVEMAFNTAADPLLGAGKNQFIPSFAVVRLLPRQKILAAALVQQFVSFGGFSDRKSFNYSRLTLLELRVFKGGWIAAVQPRLFLDWENETGVSMVLEGIVTKSISRNYSITFQGGAGLFGGLPQRYDWKVETDLRRTFR